MEKNANEEILETLLENKREDIRKKIDKINEEIDEKYGIEDNDDDFEIKNKKERKKVFRKFKPFIIGITISALALVSSNIISYNKGKQKGTKETIENMKENYLHTCDLSSAPDKIIIAWANEAYGQYSKDIIDCEILNANEKIESFKESYFQPVMKSYYDYIETNNIDRYNDFKKYVYDFEENLNTSPTGKDYSFDNSIFSYAVLVNEENNIVDKDDGNTRIFIAEDFYYGTSVTSKEGSIFRDGIMYSPYDSNENKISYFR